ncbi:protein of unknown function [Streptococcus thermophilus]|uniref:Uncharacterized protein n=1 Tax=Streptococcus thermophilus TaxID=1308 RepID=A0A8D6XQY0_STRTR|nr:protein of unknown function [Streptococcus thermophilus]
MALWNSYLQSLSQTLKEVIGTHEKTIQTESSLFASVAPITCDHLCSCDSW